MPEATEVVPALREPTPAKPRDANSPGDYVAAEWPGKFSGQWGVGKDVFKTDVGEHQMDGKEELESVRSSDFLEHGFLVGLVF